MGNRVDDRGVDGRLTTITPDLDGEDAQEEDQQKDADVGGPVAKIEQRAPDATAPVRVGSSGLVERGNEYVSHVIGRRHALGYL